MVVHQFESWLTGQMRLHGVRSATRLAREIGLDPNRVGDFLIGRRIPDEAEVERLAQYFGVEAAELLAHVDEDRRRRKDMRDARGGVRVAR
jgi:transcriptional regulator with XRE-family HTH domain